jgi:hypothetical protein
MPHLKVESLRSTKMGRRAVLKWELKSRRTNLV